MKQIKPPIGFGSAEEQRRYFVDSHLQRFISTSPGRASEYPHNITTILNLHHSLTILQVTRARGYLLKYSVASTS